MQTVCTQAWGWVCGGCEAVPASPRTRTLRHGQEDPGPAPNCLPAIKGDGSGSPNFL